MKAIVIGGGISGLSASYFLRNQGHEVSLYEATDKLGGWMQTKEVNGFSFELGPRTFQTERCPLLLSLIRELGLEVVYSKGGPRYLWHKGKLRTMQSFWPQLLFLLMKDALVPKSSLEDETIYDFACRRCGKTAAELFFDPLAKGVFGGDIRKLSIRSCFPFLYHSKWIGKAFSGGGGGLFTVRGGMGKLIEALSPPEVHLNSPIHKLPEADLVIVALPWQEASRLCEVPLDLRDEKITVVNLGYLGEVLPKKGYGYLVPSQEGEPLLGQIWDSSIFPLKGRTVVTAMIRGDNPLEIAVDAMKRHLGVLRSSDAVSVQEAVIPQYELNHYRKVASFEETVKKKFEGRVIVLGNYLHGASVEACIRGASNVMSNFLCCM